MENSKVQKFLMMILIYCCPIKVRSSIDSIKIGGQT
jgi:hypothetical protein